MKFRFKIILTIIIIMLLFIFKIDVNIFDRTGYGQAYALSIEGMLDSGEDWLDTGKEHTNTTMNTDKIKDASSTIFNVFFAIAIVLSVIVGAILAIQIMMSGIEKKADAMQGLMPYIVSCIVAFGALGIWKLVITILSNFN